MQTYQDAEARLKGRESRKLENNTYLKRRSADTIAVMLHATDVVTYHSDGYVELTTGGWKTVTTKDRISRYAPIKLWTERGVWYVSIDGTWNKQATFEDGMVVHPDGILHGTGKPPENLSKVKRKISNYAKGYVDALQQGKIEPPGPGDCFFCGMRDVATGKPLGDHDASHIQSHLDESYYVPSLAVNAMERLGASQACQWAFQACVTGHADTNPFTTIGLEQLRKVIRRYVSQQLGYQA